jgi:hypothetical protein
VSGGVTVFACYSSSLFFWTNPQWAVIIFFFFFSDQVIRENPASRGTVHRSIGSEYKVSYTAV